LYRKRVNVLTSGTLAGMILGGVLGIIGLVILIIGAVSNATKSTDQKRRVLSFCRYCGKARSEIPQTGEFCSFCGKSYRSCLPQWRDVPAVIRLTPFLPSLAYRDQVWNRNQEFVY